MAVSVSDYAARAVRWATDPASPANVVSGISAAAPAIFEDQAAVDQLEAFFAAALRSAARGWRLAVNKPATAAGELRAGAPHR